MQSSSSVDHGQSSPDEARPQWAREAARGTPSPVLPILGSALALAAAALLAFVSVTMLSRSSSTPEAIMIVGLVFLGVATLVIVFGVLGCLLKPWAILTNAILLSGLAVYVAIGFAKRGRLDTVTTSIGLLSIVAAILLYVGFPTARRLTKAKR